MVQTLRVTEVPRICRQLDLELCLHIVVRKELVVQVPRRFRGSVFGSTLRFELSSVWTVFPMAVQQKLKLNSAEAEFIPNSD